MKRMFKHTHIHHIVPRHAGGTDDESNLVELTVAEHAEAHHLLWCLHKRYEDYLAWKCLSGQITVTEAQKQAMFLGRSKGGKSHKGKVVSEETRKRMSESAKRRCKNTPREVIERRNAAIKAAHARPETKARVSAASKRNWQNPEYREKIKRAAS